MLISLQGVTRVYRVGHVEVPALRGLDLEIDRGEMVAIMGPSGSGKSTLLYIMGCLDRPTAGRYLLAGDDVGKKSDNQLADIRNRRVGFVFQNYYLLPRLSALANVEIPLIYRGVPGAERRRLARQALEAVGLGDRTHHFPNQLSGGEQQRVAIARALVGSPDIILADEPTGNLDTATGRQILGILQGLNEKGITVVLVTHDPGIGKAARRVVRLLDGRIVGDGGGEGASG
ncbi:MAG: ABC transporter ATP-binding protein [Bacillota bacterium]